MKAVVVRELGDANVLEYETDYAVPTLKPGHVLVHNTYSGLNFIDTYFRKGLYPQELPFVGGQEGGGNVVALHPNDDDKDTAFPKVGDRVVYMAFGSYAEYTLVPRNKLVPVPDDLELDLAVACMIQGLTAQYLVSSAHANLIQPGEWCLLYAVGSGTCQWAAQMAKLRGYKVIGTTSQTKLDVAQSLNCDELIVLDTVPGATYADYTSVDIVQRVHEVTGGAGVKCVVDGVGLSTYEISLACLAPRGIFVSFGNASGAVPAFPLLRLLSKSAFVTRPRLNEYIADPDELKQRCHDVFTWLAQGTLRVSIDSVFALPSAAEGHQYLESGKSKGKILYRIE